MNKSLKYSLIALLVAGVFSLFAYAGRVRSTAMCEALEVQFVRPASEGLVEEVAVRSLVNTLNGAAVGSPLHLIDTRTIEENLKQWRFVREAKVYKSIDRRLIVEVHERKPVLRLIDAHGRSAWMDDQGYLMDIAEDTPLRLPVITGHFELPASPSGAYYHLPDSAADARMEQIRAYGLTIAGDAFWAAQLQHSEISPSGEISAYPRVGLATVHFGSAASIDNKLRRLKLLYSKGLQGSLWNTYKRISLKYENQIVCTKK